MLLPLIISLLIASIFRLNQVWHLKIDFILLYGLCYLFLQLFYLILLIPFKDLKRILRFRKLKIMN